VRGVRNVIRTHVGMVPNPISERTRQIQPRIRGASVDISVCPYCAVGCSQLAYSKNGKLIDIEGKGAATFGLLTNPLRETKVKYRAPYSDHWQEKPLAWAMERIAQLVKETRDATFEEQDEQGATVSRTLGIGHMGGATLDNEENYLIKKLFAGGLGMVCISNQARI
jgi:formate dehydrogenase major subunit